MKQAMQHLRRLGNEVSVPIAADDHGFTGRECPKPDCEGYFKIVSGTGLEGEALPFHCPYCGHTTGHEEFWTQEQIRYAKSVAMRRISDAIRKDLKTLEFEHKPRGPFGIGISMKVKSGPRLPIHHYREKELETTIVCRNCTLRYAVYGVFAFCPDCGRHNSVEILEKNLEIVGKMLDLAKSHDIDLAERLVENALEDCVSAFDGFGRELCRVHAERTPNPERAYRIRFQNMDKARDELRGLGVNLTEGLAGQAWEKAIRLFQKRHVIAHKLGVVDQEYLDRTGDNHTMRGRKIRVSAAEVAELSETLMAIARSICGQFEGLEADAGVKRDREGRGSHRQRAAQPWAPGRDGRKPDVDVGM